ncbi:SEC-C metal-binding domain-containing protein [Caloramator sp. mosi_1]|uniref:SEC-C metal-binding domain-containing protein n=1 Tax=Caloramator sp. mosi_1 TaxID=3023090 RepID=UPI0023601756|nr:SEC-C metal-binding domain-containing protein [Caloramator sp. mosi_1]WDC83187.1 SEC-C metal-binding domain-containing protein [Caloramator sp. mosi_1]
MSLYKKWEELADSKVNAPDYEEFWTDYLKKEQEIYKDILENKKNVVEGKLKDLANQYGVDELTFAAFVSGINTSLVNPVDEEKLEEDTELKLEIDFEKLYYNMLDAKANWLYELPEWDGILSVERRKEIRKEYNKSKIVVNENKVGRNDPCPCGSGKKYKKCYGK